MSNFADNASATGGYAPDWNSVRFILRPKGKNIGVGDLRLKGIREFSGGGYAKEGVTHVYSADGEGKPVKITRGRQKPNEVSLVLDPVTYQNHWAPYMNDLFDFQMVVVGAAGVIGSSAETYEGCTDTGQEPKVPNGGEPLERTIKFLATSYTPPKIKLI